MISFIYLLGTIFFIGQNTGEIIKIIYGSIILKHLYTNFSTSIISLWILSLLLSFYILVLRSYVFNQEYKGNTNHYFYNFNLYFLIHFIPYAIGIIIFSTLFLYYLSTILEYTNINKDNIIFSIIFSLCSFLVECRFAYNNHRIRVHRQTAVEPLTELNSVIIINYSNYYTEVDISNTNTNCTICLEELNNCVQLKCNHVYHKECIDTWFKTNNNTNTKRCPLCRQ